MINPDISEVASIFADKSRSLMLIGLLGGARTTSELASLANIKPQTATFHLNKMIDLNFIENIKYGKFSYYKILNNDVVNVLELLMKLSGDPKIKSLKESIQSDSIKFSRICFDHMAGELAVKILKRFVEMNYINKTEKTLILSDFGYKELSKLGFTLLENLTGELCYDWSFKDYHVSGNLGKFLLDNFLINNYLVQKNNSRELHLTLEGKNFLKTKLNIE